MKIFDCFTYNGERDLLKIRMEELKGLDIQHVCVQSNYTFTGQKKEKILEQDDAAFFKYPLSVFMVDTMPNNGNPWDNEKWQRNAIKNALLGIPDYCVVIISDVDEIPRKSVIEEYIKNPLPDLTALVMDKFGYYLNVVEGRQSWPRARIMTYEYLKNHTPDEVRNSGYENSLPNAGWHFSWLGGVETMKAKLDSFSHQECNTPALREALQHKYNTAQSLWGDDHWEVVPIDDTFPEYIQDNVQSLKHLIKNNNK